MATWNCCSQLEQFLQSLTKQSWTDWELLLLDNASEDGTAELVADFQASLLDGVQKVIWSSQPDSGIYEAWNRGLTLARGEYLCFVGADDTFVQQDSLRMIAELSSTNAELITGRNDYYNKHGRFLRSWGYDWRWGRMRQSMNIAHPGMLISRQLFITLGVYDQSFCICGDYEWLLRLPRHLRTVHTSDSILKIIQAGVSHTRITKVYAETYRAQSRYIGSLPSASYRIINWLKYVRRRVIGLA